jgi:hypothetical protein
MTRDEKIQQLLDKAEIEAVLYRWGTNVGRRDWPKVRSAFHDEATDAHGVFDGGIDGFTQWQMEHHEGIEQSVHFIGSIQVQFVGPDLALVESCCICFQRFGKEAVHARTAMLGAHTADHAKPVLATMSGRYIDRFERRNAEWRIAKRVTTVDWARFDDAPWLIPFQDNWHGGKRDGSDPIYAMRREMGIDY